MKTAFGSHVLDAACRLLAPFMMLFAAYVLFHGHYSPGGGFQGGTILASATILIRMVRGREGAWGLSRRGAIALGCLGVGLYAAIGFLALFFEGNYLDYGAVPLPLPEAQTRALGTLGIETGVMMGVAGVLVLIFDSLAAWEERE
jgi:multicomponent Na+:H+ antiporter subunit B